MVASFWFREKTRILADLPGYFRQLSAPSRIPAGQRVYAIGDIHGCDDHFANLLDLIEQDDARRPPAAVTLILLGDIIDRGPDSRGVVERAMRLGERFATVRRIIGNHEELFLKSLQGDPCALRSFVGIGGVATLKSYGIDDKIYRALSFTDLAEKLPTLVPAAHQKFLASGESQIAIGDYVFVHAGIRPGVALDRQRENDLRWIRTEFVSDRRDHGKVVVHGHTFSRAPENRPNRIGIETAAYASGVLTAVGLEGSCRWFLQTSHQKCP
jgi:serine/threonine protein phosphatase 1